MTSDQNLLSIRIRIEVCVKELAARGLDTSAGRLDRHKDRVDFGQNLGVFEPKHPAVLFLIIDLEESQTVRWPLNWSASSPHLERGISLCCVSIIEVERVKDQGRLSPRVKDTAERRPVFAFAVDVVHIGNMKITGSHQVTDVAARFQ